MARVVKTLFKKKKKKGEQGHAHREHRSKGGRTNLDIKLRSDQKEYKFKKEMLKFHDAKFLKKRKILKFKL